ncbi:four-helix bundle copper-binding protein [Vulgatibacter sp.]|uniref:four-helix bundle copper-binding protein n=1 Tax=Vulgatibacter sp. TaxID=1971226 RepID=UPI00356B256D
MSALTEMLRSHPQKPTTHFDAIARCIEACFECEQICVTCADACLAEEQVGMLRECIRLNLDCADLCGATGRLISRQARPEPALWRATLEACAQACRSCAEECAKHQDRHEHCRICKESCERCERACRDALQQMPSGGAESRH